MAIFKTLLAEENWSTKYQFDGETPLETQKRVAFNLAEVEKQYGATDEDVKKRKDDFLKTLVKFVPEEEYDRDYTEEDIYTDLEGNRLVADGLKNTCGGRITANIGTSFEEATLLNCFINGPVTRGKVSYDRQVPNTDVSIPVELEGEDTPDNLVNILLTLLEQAETLKSEGGYGINFDFIRPRSTLIEGVGIRHPGVVAYMEIWDKVSEIIVRGDNDGYTDELKNYLQDEDLVDQVEKKMPRKGAMMGCLSVWHPDIEEFVKAKQEKGTLTKFNISVVVDDEFMEAVENDDFYDLRFNGKVHKQIKARELYDLITECTYNRNEPGILFYDNMQRVNPISYLGINNATNPCLSGDTWIITKEGPRQINDLVGKPFSAYVNGKLFDSDSRGFWKTGTKTTLKLTTSKGYSLRLTSNHKLYKITSQTRFRQEGEWTPVGDMEAGDLLELTNQREVAGWEGPGTFDEGWMLGTLVGDGTFDRKKGYAHLDFWGDESEDMCSYVEDIFDECDLSSNYTTRNEDKEKVRIASTDLSELAEKFGITPDTKSVTKPVEQASYSFQKGFIRGLFDADGTVIGDQSKGVSVRLAQSNLVTLEGIQCMLLRMGIVSQIYKNRRKAGYRKLPDGKGGLKDYYCKAQHELVVSKDNLIEFSNKIGFQTEYKSEALKTALQSYVRTPNRERFVDEIVSIEIDREEDVYDATIPVAHEFDANGFRAHNCGEIPGSPDMSTVCLLGSVNLTQYVREDRTFDWDAYRDDVQTFARMLENVNDLGNVPLPQYAWALENIRQYGMGINGLGSALYMMGVKYSDEEGRDFADRVCQIKEDLTLRTSALLAKERGPAPMYREDFLETYYFNEYCTASEDTKDLIRKHGVRNLKTTTNPPLGSSSVICDMVANAIEPVFSHGYDRTVIVDKWPEGLTRDNVKDVLDEIEVADATAWKGEYAGRTWYYEPHNRGLCFVEPVRDYGYNWVLEHFPEDIENEVDYLETAQDLAVKDHVAMQAVIQKNVNQSVSKTSNLPNDYDFEDFKDLYKDAWKAGLIGFTTYRAGTMEEVLSTGDDKEESSERIHADNLLDFMQKEGYVPNDADITDENVIVSDVHLPDVFENGPTKKVRADGNKYYLHMSYLPNDGDYPIALWVHSNDKEEGEYVSLNRATRSLTKLLINKGVEMDLVLDYKDKIADDMHHVRLGKMVSMALRHNIKIPDIVAALSDIEGDYIASTLTAVRKFLKDQIVDGTEAQTTCVACGSENVIYESGCDKCLDCGHSGCS